MGLIAILSGVDCSISVSVIWGILFSGWKIEIECSDPHFLSLQAINENFL